MYAIRSYYAVRRWCCGPSLDGLQADTLTTAGLLEIEAPLASWERVTLGAAAAAGLASYNFV